VLLEPIVVDLRRARMHHRPAHQAGEQEAVRMGHAVSHRALDSARSVTVPRPAHPRDWDSGTALCTPKTGSYAGNGGEARRSPSANSCCLRCDSGVTFGQHVRRK
jgi:hypothetical protein